MPFLLYADVLGARDLLAEDFDEASRVLSDLILGSLRGEPHRATGHTRQGVDGDRARGYIINDCVFYSAATLRHVVEFSSNLARHMMGTANANHPPYGLRGSVVYAANYPEFQWGDEENFWVFQVWARELRNATQADTAGVMGARLIIQADALAQERAESWPLEVRTQLAPIQARDKSLLHLPTSFDGYGADVLWMNAADAAAFRAIGLRTQEYGTRLAKVGERPALHGAATQALYAATERFRLESANYLRITAESLGIPPHQTSAEHDEFDYLMSKSDEISKGLAQRGHGQNLPSAVQA